MKLITIAEHTFDESLIHKTSAILDIGCRGFEFSNYFKRLGCNVCPVDIDELPLSKEDCENILSLEITIGYFKVAICGYTGKCGIEKTNDLQATKIKYGNEIDCYTLQDFSKENDITFWGIIKMDIEGSEYEVIMSLTEPPARQLSIEFHLHTGIYGMGQMREMETKLYALGYQTIQHELSERHGAGANYWDSLFILNP